MSEADRVRERYARRAAKDAAWDDFRPDIFQATQEKERAIVRWITTCAIRPVAERRVLDVGCGPGGDLIGLLRLGFSPENLEGWELLEARAAEARSRLPATVGIRVGDAIEFPAEEASFDVVCQNVVFTSLLDPTFQQRLADRMWALVKPGGGVLWFDFRYDNPRNRDVKGVPERRVAELFPHGEMRTWRLYLAPPIARVATRIHPRLYPVLNAMPLLRSHLLCWIRKPG